MTRPDWVSDDYRVEDTEATVARYGRQPKGEGRQKVLKMPSVITLGNLDWALRHVWLEAVADKIVDRRQRPMIDKTLGEDGEPRAFIDSTGVQAVACVMTDEWIAGNGHTPDMKRMLRTYIAMIACRKCAVSCAAWARRDPDSRCQAPGQASRRSQRHCV